MTDPTPPAGFNWGLGGAPKKPDAEEPVTPAAPPAAAPPPPPLVMPETKYPATPPPPPPAMPAAPPAAAAPQPAAPPPTAPPMAPPPAAPPAAPPPAAAPWDQPTQAYEYRAPVVPPTPAAPPTPTAPPTPAPAAWEQPTEAYDFRQPVEPPPASSIYDQLTQPYAFDSSISGATEVLGGAPVGLPELRDEGAHSPQQASAIDSLFGESQFKEYEDTALPAEGFGALATGRPREPREPLSRVQRTLVIVIGGLLVALALLAVFMIGTRSPGILPKPEAKPPVVEQTKDPVPAPPAVGPVAAGAHAWNELLGTECLDPFGSAWDAEFTVVDCAAPHAAQLVYRGIFADEAFAPYPEASELQARINLLCTSPTSINYAAAGALSDIAVSASYPASAEQWDAGEREYYCFLSRSSGEPLAVSLANAPVADEAPVASIPGNDP